MILAPIVYQRKAEDDDDKQVQPVRGFKAAYVFDVSQTHGEPMPEFATVQGDPRDHTDRLKGLCKQRGVTLEYSDAIAPAKGVSQAGGVRCPGARTGTRGAPQRRTPQANEHPHPRNRS